MGLIEIELSRTEFLSLATFLVKQSPSPDPTFEVLGDDRLVRSFDCTSVTLDDAPPDLAPPPGVVAAKVDVTIGHASKSELEADANATTAAQAVAWVYISLVPIPGKLTFVPVGKGQHLLIADLIRIDVPGRPVTGRFDDPASPRWGRQPLGTLQIPLPDIFSGIPITGSAVVLSAGAATLRVATAGQNVFLSPAERLIQFGDKWLLRVSPEVFTELLLSALVESVTPAPPGGATLIQPPSVSWGPTAIGWPGGPPWAVNLSGFGASGSYRLTKHKACGDEDVSLTVHTTLLPVPDAASSKLTFYLEISAQADDGTAFKCWLNNLGVATLVAFFVSPIIGIGFGLGSYVIVGDKVDAGVGEGVKGQSAGKGFKTIGSGDNFTISSLDVDLNLGALAKAGATMQHGASAADGVTFGGDLNLLPLSLINHKGLFWPPNGATLQGTWSSGYNCNEGWHAAFELPRIHITDDVVVLNTQKLFGKEVAVYNTSWVVPSAHWAIDWPGPAVIDQYVSVIGDQWAYTGPGLHVGSHFLPLPAGHVFLHTSAGIARFEIDHVPAPPAQPTAAELIALKANCMMLVERFDDIRWLVDPPDFDYGHDPLRHWSVYVEKAPSRMQLQIHGVQQGAPTRRLASLSAEPNESIAIEVITDSRTELRIEHDLDGSLEHTLIKQQWLLPTNTVDLTGKASTLDLVGDRLEVRPAPSVLSISTAAVAESRYSDVPPASVALPDSRVAAVDGHRLVVGYPFGGAAVHPPTPFQRAVPTSRSVKGGCCGE